MSQPTLSNWSWKEEILVSSTNKRPDALRISVPPQLQERRIYLYLEVKQSAAAEYQLDGKIYARYSAAPVAIFPAQIADFTTSAPPDTINQSYASLLNAGGSPVGDSCVLRLAQPFNVSITSVVLQPLRFNGLIDEIVFSIDALRGSNLQGWRAFLGCLSTKY